MFLCGPWPSQRDSTPNITANPTAADFKLVLIRITHRSQVSAIYLHTYRDDFECDWLTLNTAKAPIMKGCAAICNQGDAF